MLRDIEVLGHGFSREKQKAIRELNYNASGKILFQMRHRFWEAEDGIVGGTTVTDLPDPAHLLPVVQRSRRGARHAARVVHVGPGRAALGRHGRRVA